MVLLRHLLAGFALLPMIASAQPARFLIASLAGVGEATTARAITLRLQREIGQELAVEQRAGPADSAAGKVTGSATARVPAGTATLLLVTQDAFAYDTLREATPVSLIGTVPLLVATNPAVPGFSLKDRIALARAGPNPLAYASAGKPGTTPHLAGELLGALAGLKVEQLPYALEAPTLLFLHLPDGLPLVRDGKLRPLAVTSRQRSALVPDTPTVAESGVPGYEIETWFGLLLPGGTKEMAQALHPRILRIFNRPEARQELSAGGMTLVLSTPDEFAEVRTRARRP